MSCGVCFKRNLEEFEKNLRIFENRRQLVIFLLNIVLNINDIWKKYCYCTKRDFQCNICDFRTKTALIFTFCQGFITNYIRT